MKKILIFSMVAALGLFTTRCEYDNYDPPSSILSGNVMYNDVPVGVRSGATQLELWQYTWDTRGVIAKAKIVVNIDQNGFYSSRLYDGDYKLVRLKGGPWADQTDSIAVTVRGNTKVDVPVTPFFVINEPVFTFNGTEIVSTSKLSKIGTYNITSLTLYVGVTNIVDQNNSSQTNILNAAALTDLSTSKTNRVTLNATNLAKSFVYARLGVLCAGSTERYYTPVQKISLSGN